MKKNLLIFVLSFAALFLFSCQNEPVAGMNPKDFTAKIKEEKNIFNLRANESIEFDIKQIPYFLRKYYSDAKANRLVLQPSNYAFKITVGKDNVNLPIDVYCMSSKVYYVNIKYNKGNKDFALTVKKYFDNNFRNVIIDLTKDETK